MGEPNSQTVSLGLVQMAMVADPAQNVATASALVREAAAQGAQIICLPEMFNTLYFCRTQDVAQFDLAEPIPGPSVEAMQALAAELGVVIIVPTFERRAPGLYHNTAAIIDADGSLLGKYRKMHIPQDPGFEEKFYFTPGDLGFRVWDTKFGKLGVCICWDQWYPEAARLTALAGADILFYPTAIGWLPEEKTELGEAQHTAWETVQRGHSVANGCHVVAVNRVGTEGDTEFWGQSFVSDYYGQIKHRMDSTAAGVSIVECDLKAQEDFRRIWPFFRDRRIDAYDGLTKRFLD
ncbi:carbon-nitrogen hydrolase [Cerasicoccus arenae]|uniref:Apolipoprotein acyltransferase n=1 Tax=Cerasicoccus arenae TaxID=424488 RepID=A0A8J3DIQ1_9BACT|nr:carbon-nitrogen hydrolase [Cerasicoccus arenae]MBK1858777.1 carbon-nitrogen hydrolase [Cerasicoccus arenae]GHC07401.1 apolipoprotein acyltransferase [Cerasicoccus arenae]